MSRRDKKKAARADAPPPVLGLDVGGVLVDRVAEDSDTSFFGDRPMDTPRTDGSLEAVIELVELFEGRVYIVSKAGPRIARLTTEWLALHGFLSNTMIPAAHLHFVRKRPEKAPICVDLGVTHFVDDRVDVLGHLRSVKHRYLFSGGLGANPVPDSIPRNVQHVATWPQTVHRIKVTVR
ncbi:MAG: hypothetical protein JJU45_05870 [Acidimicrobiia bacterium]|nr:hypothetical protein [Acidimicrobiia bacterium]